MNFKIAQFEIPIAHVDFDATTGELLLAEEKIEHDNGDVEWKTFIQIEGE